MVTYRQPDPGCLRELELERQVALDRIAREHAADVALIRKMKSPFLAWRFEAPPTVPRATVVVAVAALVVPFVLALMGTNLAMSRDSVDTLVGVTMLGGGFAGLLAIIMSIAVFLGSTHRRGVAVASFVAGLIAIPWSLGCAVAISFAHWTVY